MFTDHIVTILMAERDKLNRAIEALQATPTEPGNPRPSEPAPKKRQIGAATRRKMALAQKRRYASAVASAKV